MIYLVVFLGSAALSLISTWSVRNFANAKGWTDVPRSGRHKHANPVPRLGGVAICSAFLVSVLVAEGIARLVGGTQPGFGKVIVGLLGPAMLVFGLGLLDDLRAVTPYTKFAVQAVAAVWLYAGGFGVHNVGLIANGSPLHWVVGLPLTVLWVLLITNAFNLIDGLDGLAAGSALFTTLVVFVVSLVVPNPMVAVLTVALAGATLGFLRFNFHPATIFLGDSGSLFIGFLLAAVALAGSEKAPTVVAVAIPLVSLGLPILDVILAVARRYLTGKPLFEGDRDHIHHKLLKRGFSQRDAVLTLYAVTAAFGFLSLLLLRDRRSIALVLSVVGIGIFLGLRQLRYQEFAEVLSGLPRFVKRRRILANHVALRRAVESLQTCNDLSSICQILRDTLEPIGFDGVRIEKTGRGIFPAKAIKPMTQDGGDELVFSWSGSESNGASWEVRLEILTSSTSRLGYLALVCKHRDEALFVDVNRLTDGFQTSLCDAVGRAFENLESIVGPTTQDDSEQSDKPEARSASI